MAPADPYVAGLEVYIVGGAVRDRLLGRSVSDRDWVIVGSTREAMLARGFRQVGRDFPVFLHPRTGEEYALARTERKRGQGHLGFECEAGTGVTLEQDLARRDLTINAMAEDALGRVIDPYGGQTDLAARTLRHVSEAFVEDPLRVFRVARFCAVLGFDIAVETQALMQAMAQSGELETLSAERVWKETEKALMAAHPGQFFQALNETGALASWFPELVGAFCLSAATEDPAAPHDHDRDTATLIAALEASSRAQDALETRAAIVFSRPEEQHCETLLDRLKPPNRVRDTVLLGNRQRPLLTDALGGAGHTHVARTALLLDHDGLRRPDRLAAALTGCARCNGMDPSNALDWLDAARARISEVDMQSVVRQTANKQEIPKRVRAAQEAALQTLN